MAKKKRYDIEVEFRTYEYVTVYATHADDAMELAEIEATKSFRKQLDSGMLGVSDFECEAMMP